MSKTGRRLGGLYRTHGEKIRYLVVGVGNTAIGYGTFLLLLAFVGPPLRGLSDSSAPLLEQLGRNYYLVVQWVGWALMVPVSTSTMKYLAFRSKGSLLAQLGRGYLVYFPAQWLSTLILWLAVRVAGLSPQLGQLVVIAIVTAFTYLGHKYFTFRVPVEGPEFGDAAEDDRRG